MQLGQVLHRSFRSVSEICYSKPATLDRQSDAATLATLILRGQMLAGPDAPALRSAWNRLTRLDLHLIFGLADLRYLLDPPENPYVRYVHS